MDTQPFSIARLINRAWIETNPTQIGRANAEAGIARLINRAWIETAAFRHHLVAQERIARLINRAWIETYIADQPSAHGGVSPGL